MKKITTANICEVKQFATPNVGAKYGCHIWRKYGISYLCGHKST